MRLKKILSASGLLLLLLPALPVVCQKTLPLEQIGIEAGLSQSYVFDVMEDSDGFLWMCTNNGLNRYDGYEFQVHKHNPYNPLSLDNSKIFEIQEAGDFFCISTDKNINLLHRKTGRFYKIDSSLALDQASRSKRFYLESEHSLLFTTGRSKKNTTQLIRLSWPENLSDHLPADGWLRREIRKEIIAEIPLEASFLLSNDKKTLWLVTVAAIYSLDLATVATTEKARFGNPGLRVLPNLLPDDGSGLWISGPGQIAHFDGQALKNYQVPSDFNLKEVHYQSGMFWGTTLTRAYGFQMNALTPVLTYDRALYRLEIPERPVWVFTDHSGNVWIGTDARGVRKFNPSSMVFRNYLEGCSVYSPAVVDGKGTAWFGDIRRAPLNSGRLRFSDQKLAPLGIDQLAGEKCHIARDENGNIWLSDHEISQESQLVRYNPVSGQITAFKYPLSSEQTCQLLHCQSPGFVWGVTQRQLFRFDARRGEWRWFDLPENLKIRVVFSLVTTPDGVMWLGTGNGMVKAVPQKNGREYDFTLFLNNPKDYNSLPANEVKSLLIDSKDPSVLWIGTNGGGLSRFSIPSRQFKHYTTADGVPDDVVYGILAEDPLPDQPYAIWFSSNRGLTRFEPLENRFRTFFKSDGLQDNEFNTNAYGKSDKGELMFGGVNGLTVFDPKRLKFNKIPPKLKISGLKINGQGVQPDDSRGILPTAVDFTEEIVLPHHLNSLQIAFAALDFSQPLRNHFEFYLEGMENAWAHKGVEHHAQYLNLPPGTYTFRLRGANSDGVWSEKPIALKIIIRPPWYASWWAYLLYTAAVLAGAWRFYRYQLKRKLEQNETIRLKELDAFKSRFFTNVSHEFRTPLTVILGSIGQLQSGAGNTTEKLQLARRNAESLLRLVNQILDLAKLEDNSLKINYIQSDILSYLRYVAESLHSLANAKNVMLRVESAESHIVMDYDPDRIQAVIHNLLSNAVKFTRDGGRVVLRAETLHWQGGPALKITVSDNGAGIPAEDLPYVFDRFFQSNNQQHATSGGTGIGLSFTRELVRAMGGQIEAASEHGAGAVFTVWLPVRNNAAVEPARQAVPGTPFLPKQSAKRGTTDSSYKLLIIEDNPDVLEYLVSCLGDDFQLDFAYNGRAGIEKALEIIPDLIISDVMMPEKDGYEVCDTVKNDERTSHIPLILLTAKAATEDRLAGLKRGADAYLAKPFNPEELRIILDNLIALRRKLQARYAGGRAPGEKGKPEETLEDAFLQKVRTAVEKNLSDPEFSGEALCRELGMSYPVVYRKLSALTGRSLHLFIRLVRLQKARELLQNPALSISEIAYETGFNDPKFFSRVFSEEYGSAPSVFRQNVDNQ